MERAPLVTQRANDVLRHRNLLEERYFTALADHSMSLDQFRKTQEQFFFAVTFFPRPMAALIARIPDPKSRLDILHNLVEEHGDFDEHRFHHHTFQAFLRLIGSQVEVLDDQALWPCVRAFNSILTTACVHDEVEVGVACMGIIEHAFADISRVIGAAVVANGWVREEDLVHYTTHAAIDERHAEEFYAVVEPAWADPKRRYFIDQGLGLGAYAFSRLYRDLYEQVVAAGEAIGR